MVIVNRLRGAAHYNWKGGTKLDHKGYRLVHQPGHPRADCKGYVREHLLVAEIALGRFIPLGVQVHHFNEIKSDNAPGNLVICQDQAYHFLLHRRADVARVGGDPNTDSFCSVCKQVKPRIAFNKDRTRPDGLRYECRACSVVIDPRKSTYRGRAVA